MNVKKYRAADSQQAMRLIQQQHGPDAVVLGCHQVPGGVEFVVAVEDGADSEPAVQKEAAAAGREPEGERHFSGSEPRVAWSQDAELLSLKQELDSVRSMLERHFSGQVWQSMSQGRPGCESAMELLAEMGIDPGIGERLAAQLPPGELPSIQREIIRSALLQALPVAPPPTSGPVALVGPPGSGKTTTLAKVAAQQVLAGGRENIALLTTDTARVGAQEQLQVYGRILQVPVHVATSLSEAVKTYRLLCKKTLLLVDTTGLSFRDERGLETLEKMVAAMPGLAVYLTLPADTESHALGEIAEAYARLAPRGAVLTRLDEAVRLGGLLSLLVQRRLPVVWCANGRRVPRNLFAGDAGKLVAMAMRLGREFSEPAAAVAPTARTGSRVNAVI